MSSKYPTVIDCLRELGQRIQREHSPTCVDASQKLQSVDDHDTSTKRPSDEGSASLNTTEVLILHTKLKMIQEHAPQANKAVLEAEKARDELHNQIGPVLRLRPQRSDTPTTRDGGTWRPVYARCGSESDTRHGYQEVCTLCG
jgi:hypothetical protein